MILCKGGVMRYGEIAKTLGGWLAALFLVVAYVLVQHMDNAEHEAAVARAEAFSCKAGEAE